MRCSATTSHYLRIGTNGRHIVAEIELVKPYFSPPNCCADHLSAAILLLRSFGTSLTEIRFDLGLDHRSAFGNVEPSLCGVSDARYGGG